MAMSSIGPMMAMVGVPLTIQTASIGIPDTMFLMVLALIVFGPRRLPEIGRQIGKLMYEFRKVSNDFKFQMEEELRASEEAERLQKLQASSGAALNVPPAPALGDGSAAGASYPYTAPNSTPYVDPYAGAASASAEAVPGTIEGAVEAVPGEVRGEASTFPHIQPPVSGEVIAAAKPFRGREPVTEAPMVEGVATASETVTESGDVAVRTVTEEIAVADEGRIGTEVQPGVDSHVLRTDASSAAETERDAHHA
jgi:sec-independent protein translocase protein TatB